MSRRAVDAVRVVVCGVAGDTRLADQLRTLPSRRPLTVEPFAGYDLLPADSSFALMSAQLSASDEVLLRLLDDPALTGVAALVGPSADGAPADVLTQGAMVQDAASACHRVADPDSSSLRAVYVPAAAATEAVAALPPLGAWPEADPVDLALVAWTRSPLPAPVAVRAEPFPARRDGVPPVAYDPKLALRQAARPGDGFYSTFVLRRISARLTPVFVAQHVHPTVVTAASFVIGGAAGPAFAFGGYPGLLIGAILLQLSLVLDCVDGEVARATRTRSRFGAWLDGATDRVKEYGALAGLAATGDHRLWALGLAGLAVQTVRHVQDASFDKGVLADWRAGLRDQRALRDTSAWTRPVGSGRGPERLTGSASLWLRRVIRMPIAERWLVLTVCALLDRPWLALTLYLALTTFAWLFTLPGAVLRSRALPTPSLQRRRILAAYADAGPGRIRMGFVAWSAPVVLTLLDLTAPLVWDAPGARHAALGFAWSAAVAWHRYDTIYRSGRVPWVVDELGGGVLVRYLAVAIGSIVGVLPWVLAIGAAWLVLVYVPESVASGIASARHQ